MSTVASLQIKIGADVSAAINGLSRAEFAADQVKEAYIAANNASVQTGAAIAVWAQNFGTAAGAVQREINGINTDNLTLESQESVASLKNIIDTSVKVSQSVTVMASAFSGAQAIAGPALAGIARLIPSIGASLAALAGPIGIAVGVAAALGAAYLSNASAINTVLTEQQKLNQSITQEIAQAGVLFGVLKSGNLTNEKRGALIEDINKKYDTTLKNLKDETEFVAQVDVAYQRLGESIKNKILLAGSQKELEGLIAQQIATEGLLEGVNAGIKAVPKLNEELFKLGASPSQTFDPKSFLGGASTITSLNEKIKGQQENINKKLAEMASLYNKVFSEAGKGDGGKGTESEAEKQQKALAEFSKTLEIIQEKNKQGLLPDEQATKAQADAIYSTIDKLAAINVKSEVFKQFVEEAKQYFNREKVEIDVVPRVQVDQVASLTPVAPLADRMKDLAEEKLKGIRITIDDTGALTAAEKFAESVKKATEGVQNVTGQAGNIADAVFGFNQATIDKKSQELDNFYTEAASKIERSSAPEEVKAKKLEELDKSVAQKRKAIAREQAAAAKKTSVFEALVNTANAVTKALTAGPIAGPILAAVIGSLGAAQVAAIAATPLPALAAGGLVSGPNTVLVGEYPGANNNPELISPVDKVKKYIVEAVNSTRGTVSQQGQWKLSGIDLYLGTQYAQDYYSRLR